MDVIKTEGNSIIKNENFFQKFTKHKLAVVAFVLLFIEVLIIFFSPVLFDLDPYYLDTSALGKAPSHNHLLGTDDLGRDILARLLYGGKISLTVGIFSTLVSFIIGIPLGVLAGYFKGKIEYFIMRAVDIFQSLPTLIIILVIAAIFGSSVISLILMIGIMNWVSPAKVVYGATLSASNMDYIEAAKIMGAGHGKILTRHVLHNVLSPVWIQIAFRVSAGMLMESSLSFLGAGIRPPEASWGNMVNAAQNATVLSTQPWVWLPAGCLLFFTIICINLVGEGIRDALDPKMKR